MSYFYQNIWSGICLAAKTYQSQALTTIKFQSYGPLRAPLECLEPEFHILKKQPFNRVASKAFQKCAEIQFYKKEEVPKKYSQLWDHHYPNCHRRAVKSQNMRPKTSLCSAIQDTEKSDISQRMGPQYYFHIFGASIKVKLFDSYI